MRLGRSFGWAFLGLLLLPLAGRAQNLVVNGSFDTGDLTGWVLRSVDFGLGLGPDFQSDCCGSATSRSIYVYTQAPISQSIRQCVPLPQAGPFDLSVKGKFYGGGGIGFQGTFYEADVVLDWLASVDCSGPILSSTTLVRFDQSFPTNQRQIWLPFLQVSVPKPEGTQSVLIEAYAFGGGSNGGAGAAFDDFRIQVSTPVELLEYSVE